MRKIVLIKVFGSMFIVLLLILSVVKVDTNIYVGDYSYAPRCIDMLLKVDDEVILDCSLYSSPFFSTILQEKLKYGFHRIRVISERARINQKTSVFLYPNQHIRIEFLGADSLCTKMYMSLNKDALIPSDSILQPMNTVKSVQRNVSEFLVTCRFNPFRIE